MFGNNLRLIFLRTRRVPAPSKPSAPTLGTSTEPAVSLAHTFLHLGRPSNTRKRTPQITRQHRTSTSCNMLPCQSLAYTPSPLEVRIPADFSYSDEQLQTNYPTHCEPPTTITGLCSFPFRAIPNWYLQKIHTHIQLLNYCSSTQCARRIPPLQFPMSLKIRLFNMRQYMSLPWPSIGSVQVN